MKRVFLIAMVVALGCMLGACNAKVEIKSDYKPGEIPGLGNAEGKLTGTPFALPEGIELSAKIVGGPDSGNYWTLSYDEEGTTPLKHTFTAKDGSVITRIPGSTRTESIYHYFGSGVGYVDLAISLTNTTSASKTVVFPAALILENVGGYCQNGVLLKRVEVAVPAGVEYHLCLSFYCGNHDKSSAYTDEEYVWGVVSDAKPLLELCDMLKNKKINIEEFDRTSWDDYYTYCDIISMLQNIVWSITDYEGLGEYDLEYINSLPDSK